MRRKYFVAIVLMTIVYFSSMAMAQSVDFFVEAIIGYMLMVGCSLIDYKWIKKNGKVVFFVAWILYIVLFLALQNIFTFQCQLSAGETIWFLLHALFMLWLPLYSSIFVNTKSNRMKSLLISIGLLIFSMLMELYGVTGVFFVTGIMVMVLFCMATKLRILHFKQCDFMIKSIGMLGTVCVMGEVRVLLYHRNQVTAFITKEGDGAYIYNVLSRLWSESKWFGQGNEISEVIRCLPRYDDTFVLTTYVTLYGKSVGVFIIVLLLAILVKALIDVRKVDPLGRFLAVSCVWVLLGEMLIAVLENVQMMPVISYSAYIPFFSQRLPGLMVSYLLMGVILSVYRCVGNDNHDDTCEYVGGKDE